MPRKTRSKKSTKVSRRVRKMRKKSNPDYYGNAEFLVDTYSQVDPSCIKKLASLQRVGVFRNFKCTPQTHHSISEFFVFYHWAIKEMCSQRNHKSLEEIEREGYHTFRNLPTGLEAWKHVVARIRAGQNVCSGYDSELRVPRLTNIVTHIVQRPVPQRRVYSSPSSPPPRPVSSSPFRGRMPASPPHRPVSYSPFRSRMPQPQMPPRQMPQPQVPPRQMPQPPQKVGCKELMCKHGVYNRKGITKYHPDKTGNQEGRELFGQILDCSRKDIYCPSSTSDKVKGALSSLVQKWKSSRTPSPSSSPPPLMIKDAPKLSLSTKAKNALSNALAKWKK